MSNRVTLPNPARPWLSILLLCLTLASPVGAAPAPSPEPESQPRPDLPKLPDTPELQRSYRLIYRDGYKYVLSGDWDQAARRFDELIDQFPRSGFADDARFWRCYADDHRRRPAEDVFSCYEDLVRDFGGSEWADDAKLAMARLAERLAREGQLEFRDRVKGVVGEQAEQNNQEVLLQVLMSLGDIGDERSVTAILDRLESTTDESLRVRIIDVLKEVESPLVAGRLERVAGSDPSARVRLAALESLGEQDSARATALHREIAGDPEQPNWARAEAIRHLADHRPPDLVPTLAELALAQEYAVARAAIAELGDVRSAAALDSLLALLDSLPSAWRRIAVINEIEDFGEAAVQPLLEIAGKDPDPRLRQAAARALGDMETDTARDALLKLLEHLDDDRS